MLKIPVAMSLLVPSALLAASLECVIGSAKCIKSQNTEISAARAIEMLDDCAAFTENDLGREALRLSITEFLARYRSRKTWFAFGRLHDSPLLFVRKAKSEETVYLEIKRSCEQLDKDFNDSTKWVGRAR